MISKRQYFVFGRLVYECLLLNICILLVLFLRKPELIDSLPQVSGFLKNLYILLIAFNLCWLAIVLWNGDPEARYRGNLSTRSKQVILEGFLFVGLMSTLAVIFKIEYFNRTTFLLPILLFTFGNIVLLKPMFEFMKRRKRYTANDYHILLVGNGNGAEHVQNYAKTHAHLGYELVGVINDGQSVGGSNGATFNNRLGGLDDLPKILDRQQVDEIFISLPPQQERQIKNAIKVADLRGVRVNLVPETPVYLGQNYRSYSLDQMPVYQLRQSPLDRFQNYLIKKIFDVVFASVVITVLSPVYLIIGLLIYLDGRGPVLYRPIRKGEAGNSFRCLKFRTMSTCDDPINGTRSTEKNDPRITRLGRFLRKYDLDELPQFFNVLKGDMSVVGPRPHRVNLQSDFRRIVDDYMVRHYIKPGITGWAQVNGWRGPTTTLLQKTERIKHDLWYIEHWSFWLDVKIVFLTAFGKKSRKNAF
ncbi:MAG: undecaprenyl-phosphate glucose phosphotransferase [Saprospiraceae bacterium]|nr:undecaprenyl-phosphate glucose phosphotransferase [Saprospiraceae bacterium]